MRVSVIPFSTIAVLLVTGLIGCESQNVSQVSPEVRRDISFAAAAKYPGNAQASPNLQAVAITDPDHHRLTIYNLSNQPIQAAAIWVNSAYVTPGTSIAPKGSLTVNYNELIEAGGGVRDFKSLGQDVSRVELQTFDRLYAVQGPVIR